MLKPEKTTDIICFCVSPNRKYVALAERMNEGLQVNIYTESTGSRVRSLEFKFLTKLPVVSMGFSTDNKYLVAATSLPDVFIYLWQVDKSRLVGMVDVPFEIRQVTISPWAYWSLCSTGPSSLRLWRLVDKQLRFTDPIPKRKEADSIALRFTAHCWFDEDRVAAVNEEGDIVIVEQGEVKRVIRSVHGEGVGLTSIVSTARGLIVGGEGGLVSAFARSFDEGYLTLLRRFAADNTARIVGMSVSPKEELLAISYTNNLLSSLSLDCLDLQRDKEVVAPVSLPVGFHSDIVTCVDVCAQKSFFVTGSADRTLRVWNFLRRRMEFTKTFDDEILSLSMHPTGLRIIIGFKSALRMYNMLATDVHPCTEFPVKPCYDVKFSTGGQFFAASVAHRVLVFNTYDFTCMAQLSGHTVLVRGLGWSRDDQFIVTTDLNGIAYQWSVESQRRKDLDDVRKGVSYSGACFDTVSDSVAVFGVNRTAEGSLAESEVTVRCIFQDREPHIVRPGVLALRQPSQRRFHTREIALSPVSQTLFVGLPNGSLYLYRYPLGDDAQPFNRLEIHDGEVLFVILTADERYLFTIGEDLTAYMFEVEALCEGRVVSRKPFNYGAFDDVCYMLQADVNERAREVSALRDELNALHAAKERDEALLVQRQEEERLAITRELQGEVSALERELRAATEKREEIEKAMSEGGRIMEMAHTRAAEDLENQYTRRTEEANAKYNQLRMERDDMIVRYENRLFKLQKEHEAEKRRVEDRSKDNESRLTDEIDSLKARLVEEKEVQDAMLDQAILDYELMQDDLKSTHADILAKKEEELSKAINSSSTGERDTERLKGEKSNLIRHLRERDAKISDLDSTVEMQKRESEAQRKEMAVRLESINVAEKKIQQLKKQTTELEKLRYVLTFKYNELKREVAPKEKQIEFTTQRVEEMDRELEKVTGDREQLRRLLDQRQDKLSAVQSEVSQHRQSVRDRERAIDTMLRELNSIVSDGDTKTAIYKVRNLLTRYDSQGDRAGAVVEENRIAEFERQRTYMEAQLSCVQRQNRQKESNLRFDSQRSTAENAALVKEINELRHEKKILSNKCQLVEAQLKDARTALQRASVVQESPTLPVATASATSKLGVASSPVRTRGQLIRGPTRALRDIAHLDSEKISRIIGQVERNNAEMERQQEEIVRLREFVSHLLSRAESYKEVYSAEDRARHQAIRNEIQKDGILK